MATKAKVTAARSIDDEAPAEGEVDAPGVPVLGDDELAWAEAFIRHVCAEIGPRRAGTPDERAAQELVGDQLARLGLEGRFEPFRFVDNLYAVLALHFGVGLAGWAVAGRRPMAGAALHALAGGSYLADTTRRAEVLRRTLPQRESQNLVVRRPAASGTPRLRVVTLAHIDAAYTGWLFDPRFVRRFAHKGVRAPWMARSLGQATEAELAAAVVASARAAISGGARPSGPGGRRVVRSLRRAEHLLALPALIAFVLNAQVVWRDETVPGATDDLSGVAATVLLAARLQRDSHPDVEHVFVITGAEEAGTGGARRLVAAHRHDWDPATTVVVGLDGLSNGELFWAVEGELRPTPIDTELEAALWAAAASDPRFARVGPFEIPVGSTDAKPFACAGYPATSIICTDLELGSPRHYHHPHDTPDALDWVRFGEAVDFAELALREITARRLG
jgi:hypothetical protein